MDRYPIYKVYEQNSDMDEIIWKHQFSLPEMSNQSIHIEEIKTE